MNNIILLLLLVSGLSPALHASGDMFYHEYLKNSEPVDQIVLETARTLSEAYPEGSERMIRDSFSFLHKRFSAQIAGLVPGDKHKYRNGWTAFLEARWYEVIECFLSGLRGEEDGSGHRPEGFSAVYRDLPGFMIRAGIFLYPCGKYGLSRPVRDHPVEQLFTLLKDHVQSRGQGGAEVMDLMERDLFAADRQVWSKSAVACAEKFFQNLLESYSQSILNLAIKNEHFKTARRWLELCNSHNISFLKEETEGLTGVLLPVTCPDLEVVLSWLRYDRDQMAEKLYSQKDGSWTDHDTMEKMICELLDNDPFSEKQIKKAEAIFNSMKDESSAPKSRHLRHYCRTGYLKNILLAMLGARELRNLLLSDDELHLREFFRYINGPGSLMKLAGKYRGFYHLFHLNENTRKNLLSLAFSLKNPDFIELLYFVLCDGSYRLENKNRQNQLHQLLLPVPGKMVLSVSDEKKALKILRFMLYSGRILPETLELLLKSKDVAGRTPLRLAADSGLYRCYSLMKNFLKEEGLYNNDDHAGIEDLQLIFLNGMLHRSAKVRDRAIDDNKKRINEIISVFTPLSVLEDPENDPEVSSLVRRIRNILNPESLPENKAEEAFKEVFRTFWENPDLGNFPKASTRVKMSYLKFPLQVIVRYMVKREQLSGTKREFQLLSDLCGDLKYYLDSYLLREIEKLITVEMANARKNKRDVEPLSEEAFYEILGKYK